MSITTTEATEATASSSAPAAATAAGPSPKPGSPVLPSWLRRLAIPTVIVAGVVAAATVTGIGWTGASEAATGVRLQADAGHGATLTISELEPGDSVSKTVTIRNSAAVDSRLSFEENAAPATFAGGELRLRIDQDGRSIYDGVFGGMNDIAQDVGSLAPGGSSTFTFTVSLPGSAPFANQGDPAVANYTWVTTAG